MRPYRREHFMLRRLLTEREDVEIRSVPLIEEIEQDNGYAWDEYYHIGVCPDDAPEEDEWYADWAVACEQQKQIREWEQRQRDWIFILKQWEM